MVDNLTGLAGGGRGEFERRFELLQAMSVDEERLAPSGWSLPPYERTIASEVAVSGAATYHRGQESQLRFRPGEGGWHFNRTDLPEQFPIEVNASSVVSSQRNILLGCGCESNRMRMSEHIIALRLGLGIDSVMIDTPNGDPPLFDVGSRPLVEALNQVGVRENTQCQVPYWSSDVPVFLLGNGDAFLLYEPAEPGCRKLTLDVAIDFPTVIGRQRIVFDVTPEIFAYGADARTNCSQMEWLLLRTIGRLSPQYRGYGYTPKNILVAGKTHYVTEPALRHNGRCMEAVWHRACLDLLAALALCPFGRLAGKVTSYKSGHGLDCRFMSLMCLEHHWQQVK